MARLLILVALVFLFTYLAAKGIASLRGKLGEVLSEPDVTRRKTGSELVACSVCGVHVPRSRALPARGGAPRSGFAAPRFYCSEHCRQRAAESETIRTRSA